MLKVLVQARGSREWRPAGTIQKWQRPTNEKAWARLGFTARYIEIK